MYVREKLGQGGGGGGRGCGQFFYFKNIEDSHFSIFDRKYKCINLSLKDAQAL